MNDISNCLRGRLKRTVVVGGLVALSAVGVLSQSSGPQPAPMPPPIAAPRTAATNGLSKSTNASMRPACGDSPGPGGFLRKSSISLPAQNESPAPCQTTIRVLSSFAASLKMRARATYMADVIAFRFVGRFNWTRRMLPACSVTISSIVEVLVPFGEFYCKSRFGAAPAAPTVSSR